MLREDKQTVIRAIGDLGHRVTAADVASKTGLSLAISNQMLNTIAAEAGGHLEVSAEGDIAYRFKIGFQTAYLATGLRAFLTAAWTRIFAVIFYLLKISFGLFLIISLLIVVLAFSVLTVLSSGLGNEREDFRLGEMLQFFNLLIVRDLLFWGSAGQQARRNQQILAQEKRAARKSAANGDTEAEDEKDSEASTEKAVAVKEGSFFINCFSFLFGDGSPNLHLEETKWQLVAQTIREQGGVVMKEHLAPFLGPDLDDQESILPVLSRFDGRPAVTSNGNIAYIFPSLQVTSDTDRQPNSEESVAALRQGYLEEKRWTFSDLSEHSLKSVYIIAGLNLFGTWWMYVLFNRIFQLHLLWVDLLAIYGTLFVVIPTMRQVWQNIENGRFAKRNAARAKAADVVSQPDEEMREKLAECAEFSPALQLRAVAADQLAYTTDQTNLEQNFPQEQKKSESESENDEESK
ncbi:MAG: hypothetical protein KGS72_00220 [Cyanobacteria bacterium REEB67]|nr:hypothetical protein [Cyanobacteria bacterium REEB67]